MERNAKLRLVDYVFEADPKNVYFRCVEDCNETIMITDMEGKLLYANPAWHKAYGYTKEEAIGQKLQLIHSGYQGEGFYKKMWDQILNPEIGRWRGELINKAKDGRLIHVLLTITPVRNYKSDIVGYLGIALDISEQKQLEARVLQQDRLASIGMLASGLAHEIGTPLGVIRGRAEFLAMSAAGNETLSSGLQVIVSQIDRISKLINSLLRFSRTQADISLYPVDLNEVVQEVLTLVSLNLKQYFVDLKIEISAGTKVLAEANQLQQIFLNLLINSAHAIHKAITDGRKSPHRVTITARLKGDKVWISVRDTGCGISPENMRKLFQPFFTTKDTGEGTGLGLAIVSKLVHDMNGDITAESTLNEGTTFFLTLKRA